MRARWSHGLIAAVLALPAPTTAAVRGTELAPYREFATSTAGQQLVAVAQRALASDATPSDRSPTVVWPGTPRPVYVTLVQAGATRACLGTDSPLGSLDRTVHTLATRLLTDDRRRAPVGDEELDRLRLVIAFAGEPQSVADPQSVDPMREGMRIETDRGAIAFLPGEARTVAWALREARRVGVLTGAVSDARYSRFAVVTLSGPARIRTRD